MTGEELVDRTNQLDHDALVVCDHLRLHGEQLDEIGERRLLDEADALHTRVHLLLQRMRQAPSPNDESEYQRYQHRLQTLLGDMRTAGIIPPQLMPVALPELTVQEAS